MSREVWRPNSRQQTLFLSSSAFEALFGGQAGPGKTDCLAKEPLRQIENPRYNAILFRRTFPKLEAADGLIARSEHWYPSYGGRYNATKHYWRFPSGARIYFGHMQHEWDKQNFQGAQYAFIGFDELTEFEESQYLYLFTRCRVPADSGLRAYVRAATNPGNTGHEWVKRRFITTDIVNRKKYFALINDVDTVVDRTHPEALSRAFYPASMADNPAINADEYRRRILLNPDPVERARLLEGNWDITSSAGRVYPNWSFENISDEADYHAGWDVVWGADDGYAEGRGPGSESYHPRVILIGQRTPIGGLNIFWEYYKTGEASYEPSIHEALAQPVGLPDTYQPMSFRRPPGAWELPDVVHIDSSAAMFKGAIRNQDLYVVGATHAVSEGIKNLRRLICDGNGVRLLRVHPRCKNLIRELAGYRMAETGVAQMGEPKPLKVDDHGCLVAGTLITTIRGTIPIEHVLAGDKVLTRHGFNKVNWSGMTHPNAEVYTVNLSNGTLLTGTGNHPVYVLGKSYTALKNLAIGDILIPSSSYNESSRWTSLSQSLKKSNLMGLNSGAIRSLKTGRMPIISDPMPGMSKRVLVRYIRKSGKQPMAIFQKVLKFITKIATPAIMTLITWCVYPKKITTNYTSLIIQRGNLRGCENVFRRYVLSPSIGTKLPKADSGINGTGKRFGITILPPNVFVSSVANNLKHLHGITIRGFAQMLAKPLRATHLALMMKIGSANSAAVSLPAINILRSNSVPTAAPPSHERLPSVIRVDLQSQRQPVYNLTVDVIPEYFANGILVHNCDTARYMAWPLRIPD